MGCRDDITLSDALSDPIVQALMRADGVDPQELEAGLLAVARELDERDAPPLALA